MKLLDIIMVKKNGELSKVKALGMTLKKYGISIDQVYYKNQYGHFVWTKKDDLTSLDMTWPGLKPLVENAYPVVHEGEWWWATREKSDK